jgi:hypothetical protein
MFSFRDVSFRDDQPLWKGPCHPCLLPAVPWSRRSHPHPRAMQTPRRFIHASLKNSTESLSSQLTHICQKQDATGLEHFYSTAQERVDQVKSSNISGSFPETHAKTVALYLFFCLETDLNNPVARHDAIAAYFETFSGQIFGGSEGSLWHVPCLKSIARSLVETAWEADLYLLKMKQRPSRANALSRYLQPTFRYAIPMHRRPVLLWISNLSFRAYLRLGSLTLCDNMLTGLSTASINVSEFPKADQVEFRYWLGRIRLMQYYFRPVRLHLGKLTF